MRNFVAIDVETANYSPSSICSIGAVKVVDGNITDSFYSLVKPEPEWYLKRFTAIHGLTKEMTCDAPSFDRVWPRVMEFAGELPMVAHNARFDYSAICAACRVYRMETPSNFLCTLQAARRKFSRSQCPSKSLPNLCQFMGIEFNNHHNALADAEAAAKIAITIL